MLWTGLSAAKDKKLLNPRDKFSCQMQALSFLLLLDRESAAPSFSKAPVYMDDAVAEFESSCGSVTKKDAAFLLQEVRSLFNRCCEEDDGPEQCVKNSGLCVISEMLLIVIKVLCKAGHYDLASTFLSELEAKVRERSDRQCAALSLGKCGVKVHSALKAAEESAQPFTECARVLRALPEDLRDREAHAVLEGCSLVVWAVEDGHNKGLSGPVLLAWFSFLEEHQELILKVLKKVSVGNICAYVCVCVCPYAEDVWLLVFTESNMSA